MTRFIRSALFPILIVIILALFIEWAIQRGDKTGPEYTYQGKDNSFVSDINAGRVAAVVMNISQQMLEVTTTSDPPVRYRVGFPDSGETTQLIKEHPTVWASKYDDWNMLTYEFKTSPQTASVKVGGYAYLTENYNDTTYRALFDTFTLKEKTTAGE